MVQTEFKLNTGATSEYRDEQEPGIIPPQTLSID
jgi:hypothetical protein